MRSGHCALAALLLLVGASGHAQTDVFFDGGPFYDEVIFDRDFAKGRGPLRNTVVIDDPGSTVRVFLRNGSDTPSQAVRSGLVYLNGQVIFNRNDFKVEGGNLFAVVTKEVALLPGANTLDVELSGVRPGTVNLRILRARSFAAGSIFVAPPADGGDDSNSCDSPSTPCATIARGIVQAVTLSGSHVHVANGVYVENVTLEPGISLLGGYSSNFVSRSAVGTGTLIHGGGTSPTVLADNVSAPTLLEGFIVHGPTIGSGSSSVAILIMDSTSALQVRSNVIVAGVAGAGTSGIAGGNGAPGTHGTPGGNSLNTAATISGGAGGVHSDGPVNISGGGGGNSTPPLFEQQNGSGLAGRSSAGGSGGAGGYNGRFFEVGCSFVLPPLTMDGQPGLNGGSGDNRPGGTGGLASRGSGLSGTWISANGSAGTAGVAGGGGGGGGAGGGSAFTETSTCVPNHVTGPSGGGGGSGGAAGGRGEAGQGGGGTFGVFVFDGAATIVDNLVFLGTGGNGGAGGNGGVGGTGGRRAPGGSCLVLGCGAAGDGGDGGDGGHGGGGGGGAGGPSVGVYSNFSGNYGSVNTIDSSTGVSGMGGPGGLSLGLPGQAGESGGALAILEQL